MGLSLGMRAMTCYQVTSQNCTHRGALVYIWKFKCINSPCKAEFISIWGSHVSKKQPFFLFSHQVIEDSSAQQTFVEHLPALGISYARCTKTSNAWSLLSEAESLWALRQGGCLKYSPKFARTGIIVRFGDGFAEILKIKPSYQLKEP